MKNKIYKGNIKIFPKKKLKILIFQGKILKLCINKIPMELELVI